MNNTNKYSIEIDVYSEGSKMFSVFAVDANGVRYQHFKALCYGDAKKLASKVLGQAGFTPVGSQYWKKEVKIVGFYFERTCIDDEQDLLKWQSA